MYGCESAGIASHQHNHVVPRSQIDLFAEERKVACHFADGTQRVVGSRNVGVRKNFYSVKGADGSVSTGFERAINPIETKGIVVLREIDDRWPLKDADRVSLCEFLALQAVRSPAYRLFFEQRRDATLRERADGLDPARQEELEAAVLSDQFTIENVIGQIAKMATLFGSMHTTLLRFDSPRLLCSDHPLAPVPFMNGSGAPIAAMPSIGFLNTIEFRFPVSSERALLLTWREHDDDFPLFTGKLHHLKSINASVRDQAEQHWFHRPDISAPCASGPLLPLSFELFGDYELSDAIRSERRRQAQTTINHMIDHDIENQMQLMTVSRADGP
jgi:Protein of unknown function (DUF4238)